MKRPITVTTTRCSFRGLAAGVGLASVLTACGGGSSVSAPTTSAVAPESSLVVGSADFPESQIVAEIYAGALNAAGVTATTKHNIGAREVYFKALHDGSIDLAPDYSGKLLSQVDAAASESSAGDIYQGLPNKLPGGLGVLEPAKAESKDAMVVTKATAEKYQLKSIEDLAKVCQELIMAAPSAFETRPNGLPGLSQKYGCEIKGLQPINDGGGKLTLEALLKDAVQIADIPTTMPSIADNDLVVLEDPKSNFMAQQVLPLYNTGKMTDNAREALNAVSKNLTTEDLVNLNRSVSGSQKQGPKDAAAAWLKDKGIVI